jgi:hypothetical protein
MWVRLCHRVAPCICCSESWAPGGVVSTFNANVAIQWPYHSYSSTSACFAGWYTSGGVVLVSIIMSDADVPGVRGELQGGEWRRIFLWCCRIIGGGVSVILEESRYGCSELELGIFQ